MKIADEHILCPTCGHQNSADAFYCQKDGTPLRAQDGEPSLSDADPLVGRMVGNYRLLARKGEGGFGVVYRAEHRDLQTIFAVKILHPQFSANRQAAERFKREALAAGRLRHEHVVYIADFGFAKGIGYYYAMEYLEGRTLKEMLEREGPFSATRILNIARQVTAAMERVHSLKIVHRDLKPENIFLIMKNGSPDYVKLVDFGIAKMMDEAASNITRTGLSVGTPLYMSPEQARGNLRTLDHRTDIYSWAVILYEMLAGRPPFFSDNPHDVVMLHIRAPLPPLSESSRRFTFHPDIEAFFRRALAKSPTERPESMIAFLQELEPLLLAENALRDKASTPPRSFALAPPIHEAHDPLDETPVAPSRRLLSENVDLTQVATTNDQLRLAPSDAAALRSADISSVDSTPPKDNVRLPERPADWRAVFQTQDPSISLEEQEETVVSPDFLREEVKSLSRLSAQTPLSSPPSSSFVPSPPFLTPPKEDRLPQSSPDLAEVSSLSERSAPPSSSAPRTIPNLDRLPVPPHLLSAPLAVASNAPALSAAPSISTAPASPPPSSIGSPPALSAPPLPSFVAPPQPLVLRSTPSLDDLLDAKASPRFHRMVWIGGSVLGGLGILFLLLVAFLPSPTPSVISEHRLSDASIPALTRSLPSELRAPFQGTAPSETSKREEPLLPDTSSSPMPSDRPLRASSPSERPAETGSWRLTIEAQPPATCLINNQDLGMTPCSREGQGDLPLSIELARKGFVSIRTTWRFQGKSKESLSFKLKRRKTLPSSKQPTKKRSSDGLFEDTRDPFDQPHPSTPKPKP